MRTTRKNLRKVSLTGLVFLMVLGLSGSAMAQGSIFGTVTNADLSTPANGEVSFSGFLDDTDEEIRIESSAGAGFDAGNWFDDFQNYLTEGPGNPYDYYFYNVVNGEGFHLANPIPNNSFQQENIQLAANGWPVSPAGLTASALSSTAILVRWTAVPGLTYHVYRRTQPSTSSFFRRDNPSGNLADPGVADSFFVDVTSNGVSSYDYLIIAEDGLGNLSPHSTVFTVDGSALVAPSLVSINPNHGPAVGGTLVNLYGSGFDPAGVTVQFDAVTPVAATVISPFHITATAPAVPAGVADITTTNFASGLASNIIVGGYTYDANTPPVLAVIGAQQATEGNLLSFGVSATDVELDIPILSYTTLPGTATFTDNGNGTGTFNWQTTFVDAGSYPVTFYATDLIDPGLVDSEQVVITVVDAGNQTPTWTQVNDTTVAEGQNLLLTLLAADVDATTPILTAINVPTNASFNDNVNGSGTFSFTPDFTQAGLFSVTFVADDGISADSMTLQITVTNTNLPPQLVAVNDTTINEMDTLTLIISASDPDSDLPLLSVVNAPATHATFLDNGDGTGLFEFIPDFSQGGVYPISFIANDGNLADTMVVTVTVASLGNQPPVLAPLNDTTINEGDTLIFTITATDADLTIPTLSLVTPLTNAILTDSANGTALFVFHPDFSQGGLYALTFVADDGALADSVTVTITVLDQGNLAPIFSPLADTAVSEGGVLSLTVSVTDPDALPGEFAILSLNTTLTHYTFVDHGDNTGLFTYNPNYFDASVRSVSFFATDHGSPQETGVATIQITTRDVNRPPSFAPIGPFGVSLGETLVFTVIVSDSTDPDTSRRVLLTVQNAPANSSFVNHGNNTGTFTFTPDASQVAPWVISFLAVDLGAPARSATMNVNVDVVVSNSPPVISGLNQAYLIDEGQTLNLTMMATDADGLTPVLTAVNLPENATFVDNTDGTGSFSFTPDFIQGGSGGNSNLYYVTFRAFDGFVFTRFNVIFQVRDAGDQVPAFDPLPTPSVTEGDTVIFSFSAYDPDGLPVTLSVVSGTLPPNATFADSGNGVGVIEFLPDYSQSGSWDVLLVVDDGSLADTTTLTITVVEAGNQNPVLAPVADVSVGELHNINFTVTASDPDGDFPLLSSSALPGVATFADQSNGTGIFNWTPTADDAGTYAIKFYAEDAAVPGLFDSLEMILTVIDTNRAPRGNTYNIQLPNPFYEADTLIQRVYGFDRDGAPPTITAALDGQDTLATNMVFNFPIITGDTVYGELVFIPDYTQGGPNPGVSYNVRFSLIDAVDPTLITPVPIQPLTWFVWNRNQPPEFRFVPDSTGPFSITEGDSLRFSVIGVDPDGIVKPTLVASGFPANSFANGTSDSMLVRFYPDFTQSGNYQMRFVVTDIGGAADTQLVDIEVIEAGNQAPLFITQLSATTNVPASTGLLLWIRCSDPDQDAMTITVEPTLSGALFVDSGNGRAGYAYIPDINDVGAQYAVSVIVTDAQGLADTITTVFNVVSFLRGDLDMNSKYTMNDLAFLISYLYRHADPPAVAETADVDGDGSVSLLDVTYLIRFLYSNGPKPPGE